MKLRKLEKAKRERSTMKRRKYPRERIPKSNSNIVGAEEVRKSLAWSSEDEKDYSISSTSLPSVSDSEFEGSQFTLRLQRKTI
ncbi:hypothetical protein KM043_010289 [Ampulex compressa]|nr:hypothetical protein KM043_010289 [Ampulex compressa]